MRTRTHRRCRAGRSASRSSHTPSLIWRLTKAFCLTESRRQVKLLKDLATNTMATATTKEPLSPADVSLSSSSGSSVPSATADINDDPIIDPAHPSFDSKLLFALEAERMVDLLDHQRQVLLRACADFSAGKEVDVWFTMPL